MLQSGKNWCWKLEVATFLTISGAIIALSGDYSLAQSNILPDSTLGVEGSIIIPRAPGSPVDEISGGAIRGANLFHSFQEFNVSEGRGAYFFSPDANIQNILARVTGSNGSKIYGTLGTFGNSNPNLFLINPNGIIFGQNASLDVRGSFVPTTANAVKLGETGIFSASEPASSNLLSINPSAFFFNALSNKPIANYSTATRTVLNAPTNGLQVPDGKSLLLVGGDVSVNGGELTAWGGRVELGGVAGLGTVGLFIDGNNLRLSFPSDVARANVSLTNEAFIDVTAGGGGSITLNAQNLKILGGSKVLAGIWIGLGSVGSQAGDITLNATGAMTVANSLISNAVETDAVGNAGNINIQAGALSLTDKAYVGTATFNRGKAGNLSVRVDGSVSVKNSFIYSSVATGAVGDGGGINIQAGALSLTDGAQLTTSTQGQGNGGNIDIQAGSLSLVGSLAGNPLMSAETLGQGDAGNISVLVDDTVSLTTGSLILNGVRDEGVGDGGDIYIQARSLSIEGAALSTTTTGQGRAGNIQINASDSVNISGVLSSGDSSGLFSTTEEDATGQGGEIRVSTDALRLSDGAILSTRTKTPFNGGNIIVNVNTLELERGGQLLSTAFSSGRAGNITVNSTDKVTVSGSDPNFNNRRSVNSDGPASGLFARTEGTGAGGTLLLTTGQLQVLDGATVAVSSVGSKSGATGNLDITASSITLDKQGKLIAESDSGIGGDIKLTVPDLLLLRRNSSISTNSGSTEIDGRGGRIIIDARFIVAVPSEDSNITANAYAGPGGSINITTQGIYGLEYRPRPTQKSDITVSSTLGIQGTFQLNTPGIDPSRGLTNLPTDVVDASNQIAQNCATGGAVAREQSSFVDTRRGGLPPNPKEPLSSDDVFVNWVALNPGRESPFRPAVSTHPTSPTPVPLVEAQGWVINDKGQVILTATAPTVTPHSPWQKPTECHAPQTSS